MVVSVSSREQGETNGSNEEKNRQEVENFSAAEARGQAEATQNADDEEEEVHHTIRPRDYVGYGKWGLLPESWPNKNTKVALNFVIHYEEGSEECVLHGDGDDES